MSTLHRLCYAEMIEEFGQARARLYAEANDVAMSWCKEFLSRNAGDLTAHQRPACVYARPGEDPEPIEREVEAIRALGLEATLETELEGFPVPIEAAAQMQGHVLFHAGRYGAALARAFTRHGGRIYEHSRVEDVEDDGRVRLWTQDGELLVEKAIIATLLPFMDRGAYFTRTHPRRGYVLTVELEGPAPPGMYISANDPVRSVRPVLSDAQGERVEDRLLITGENHSVGRKANTWESYQTLWRWCQEHFEPRRLLGRYSSQDYVPVDRRPFVRQMTGASERLLVATGFNKWGYTNGTAAAMMLTDLIEGVENPWHDFFDARRVGLEAGARDLVPEDVEIARDFVGDRLHPHLRRESAEQLERDEGGFVELDGELVAAYRDDLGRLHTCSPVCTHLGCHVQRNEAERSWDCPCHGSRFSYRGEVLHGPAVDPLEVVANGES